MVKRLITALRRRNGYPEVVLNLVLPDKVSKTPRPKAGIKVYVIRPGSG
jgi:hypothetical protein